jgi:hypothetical protein
VIEWIDAAELAAMTAEEAEIRSLTADPVGKALTDALYRACRFFALQFNTITELGAAVVRTRRKAPCTKFGTDDFRCSTRC